MRGLWAISVLSSILILGLSGALDEAYAEVFTAVNSGDYHSAFTWHDEDGGFGVPGPLDQKDIPSGITVTLSGDDENFGLIQIFGTLIIDAKLTNHGFFDGVDTFGIVNLNGVLRVTPGNSLVNNGLIDNLFGAQLIVEDQFDNPGFLRNNFAQSHGHFHNEQATITIDGIFVNEGDVHQLQNGIFTVTEIGAVLNSGDGAVWDNRVGSTLNIEGGFFMSSDSFLNNKGNINNFKFFTVGDGATLNNNALGILTNTGKLSVEDFSKIINNANGKIINNFLGEIKLTEKGEIENKINGNISNNLGGTIILEGENFQPVKIDNFGVLDNKVGKIEILAFGGIGNFATGEIFNTGNIKVGQPPNTNTILVNAGMFTNKADGTLAIITDFKNIGGTFTNESGGNVNIDGTFTNDHKFDNSGNVKINPDSIAGSKAILDNEPTGILKNLSGGTIFINDPSTLKNQNIINNLGKIIRCGTYEGTLPTDNALLSCGVDVEPPEIKVGSADTKTLDSTHTQVAFNEPVDGAFNVIDWAISGCGPPTDITPSGPQIGVESIMLEHCDIPDPSSTPDVTYFDTIGDLQDQAVIPNVMETQTITVSDGRPPSGDCTISSNNQFDIFLATIGDTITLECTADENLGSETSAQILGREPDDLFVSGPRVDIITDVFLGDPNGKTEYEVMIIDVGGNPAPLPITQDDLIGRNVVVDSNGLAVDLFSVVSSNPFNSQGARVGEIISIIFDANENIMPATLGTITVNGNPVPILLTTPTGFVVEYTVLDTDPDGPLDISITVDDLAGNSINVSQDAITSGENVVVDNTPPEFDIGFISGKKTASLFFNEIVHGSIADVDNLDLNPGGPPDTRIIIDYLETENVISLTYDGPEVLQGTEGTVDLGADIIDFVGNPLGPLPGTPLDAGPSTLILTPTITTMFLTSDTFVEIIDTTSVPSAKVSFIGLPGGPGIATSPPHPLIIENDMATVTIAPNTRLTNLPSDEILKFSVSTKPVTGIPGDLGFVYEVGKADVDIFSDTPFRIQFLNKAGGIPFFIPASGVTTEITTTCPADDITIVTPLIIPGPPNECALDVGTDKVIYPNHLTAFGAGGGGATAGADSGKGSTSTQKITMGKLKNGAMAVHGGFCFNLFCIDVLEYFNHLELQHVDSNESFTVTLTGYFPNGANRANYASIGAAPPGGDINDSLWNVIAKRVGASDQWDVMIKDKDENLGSATVTVQPVDGNIVAFTFTILSHTPATIGTPEGDVEPSEDNLILVTELRDNRGNSVRNIFNEGFFVDDIYAYPKIESLYDSPLEYEALCLNEDEKDRYTCAFDMVRQWTIKQAEERLKEMYGENNIYMDSYDESEQLN